MAPEEAQAPHRVTRLLLEETGASAGLAGFLVGFLWRTAKAVDEAVTG